MKNAFLYPILILCGFFTNLFCMNFNAPQNLGNVLEALNRIGYSSRYSENCRDFSGETEPINLNLNQFGSTYKVEAIKIDYNKYIAVHNNPNTDNALKNEYVWSKMDEIIFIRPETNSYNYLASNTILLIASEIYWTFIWKMDKHAHVIVYDPHYKLITSMITYDFINKRPLVQTDFD